MRFTNFFADNSPTEGFRSIIDHTGSIILLKGTMLLPKEGFLKSLHITYLTQVAS